MDYKAIKILLILCLFISNSATAMVVASFKVHSYQQNKTYLLKEIVHFRNTSSDELARIENIKFDTTKYPRNLTKHDIQQLLKDFPIEWKGKSEIQSREIAPIKIAIGEFRFHSKACLERRLSTFGYEYTVTDKQKINISAVNTEDSNIEFQCQINSSLDINNIPKNVSVSITAINKLTHQKLKKNIWFDVTLTVQVLTAKTNIPEGQILNADYIEKTTQILSGVNQNFTKLQKALQANKYIATQEIAKGSIIIPKHVKLNPDIRKNQQATLSLDEGPFLISLKVTALESGYIDQKIKIYVPSSQKLLLAKITGKGELKIE